MTTIPAVELEDSPGRRPEDRVLQRGATRRLTTAPHAEFVGMLAQEFRRVLAPLQAAAETLVEEREQLPEPVAAELSMVAREQAGRVVWLVQLLEAVDGDVGQRRVEPVDATCVVHQAARRVGAELELHLAKEEYTFEADAERVRLGVEALLLGLGAESGRLRADMPSPRLLAATVQELDLDDRRRRWHLQAGWRILEAEGCQVRLQRGPSESKVAVRFG